jgi:sugar (pentulose or hexulose) kinase
MPGYDEKTYLCFDLGTTRIKSALLDSRGEIIYLDSEKALSHREGDAVIQKPEEYYQSVIKQIGAMAKKYGKYLKKADSLICSGQMAGILSIDENWEVVMPWTYSVDTRANKYLSRIEDSMASAVRASSGGVPFMAAKIKWIKEELPDHYSRIPM